MRGLLLRADDLLRSGTPPDPARSAPAPVRAPLLLAMILVFGAAYGAAMGTYGGGHGIRPLQMLYSAIKVPGLLLGSFALSVPSYFVLNSLLGLRQDLAVAARALLAAQAALTIVLCALAPVTMFFYAGSNDYPWAIVFHALMFTVASIAGQLLLRRLYRPLIARDTRHRLLLRLWLVIYGFVGIQMGWLLRPFIGHPEMPTQFFRPDSWGNAYVHVARLFWQALTHP
jgi:hypothetical protein